MLSNYQHGQSAGHYRYHLSSAVLQLGKLSRRLPISQLSLGKVTLWLNQTVLKRMQRKYTNDM